MTATTLRMGRSCWLDDKQKDAPRTRYSALRGSRYVDVAIVGGGITGAIVAQMFADAGVRVALLEATRVGRGSTAASTALLMQEPDTTFGELSSRYGARATRRIWQLNRAATAGFIRTLTRLRIRCELRMRDSIYHVASPDGLRDLRGEFRQRRRNGVPCAWLDPAALRGIGIVAAGAIRTRGNAVMNPYRACLGLLEAARRRGAEIFEESPVTAIAVDASGKDGQRVTLETARGAVRGTIRADHVVIATGYATPEFEPLLGHFKMMQTYVAATPPLPSSARRAIGLSDVMLWDTGEPYHYARWTHDGRLLMGGADRPRVANDRQRANALRDGVRQVRDCFDARYPALAEVGTDLAWEGLFAVTPDGLPYIGTHARYPRHLFALGYGGNGMTFSYLAATLLLQMYRGRTTADHDLFAFSR